MDFVSGEILTDIGFKSGYIGFEKEKIVETGKGNPPKKPICKGLIVPTFINAHTHIGDSFIREKKIDLPKNVKQLVAPPNGLKHKLLREASDEDIIDGMEKSIDIMIKNGTRYFCDFRENGILGISHLKAALQSGNLTSLILSRPDSLNYNKNEVDILLKNSDGIAISSISDWDYSELQKVARDTRHKNKIFALHASERIRENIDDILDLKPNFKLLKKVEVNLLLGTDNAMLNSPVILEELNYLRSTTKEFSTMELLYMITFGARKALNLDCDILGPNSKADFVVLGKKSLKPLYISFG